MVEGRRFRGWMFACGAALWAAACGSDGSTGGTGGGGAGGQAGSGGSTAGGVTGSGNISGNDGTLADAGADAPTTGGKDAGSAGGTSNSSDTGTGGAVSTLDSGSMDSGPLLPGETRCRTLPDVKDGVCLATAGTSGGLLVTGTILTPTGILRGGEVLADQNGVITCVGCDCRAGDPNASVVTCPHGVVSPGLINTHDHLSFAQQRPHVDTGERYEQRQDFRLGLRQHTQISYSGSATADQVRWGELRFVLGGATSTVGAGTATGLLRNLDKTDQEGLARTPVTNNTFPLDDATGPELASGCGYGPNEVTAASLATVSAWEGHVGEGIDDTSHNEFVCLAGADAAHDIRGPKTTFVHGASLLAADYRSMATTQTGLVWTPRSNIALYGDTARITVAARAGVLIALGSDWIPTGSMNLLRELHCADDWNRTRLASFFSDRALWEMVTANAAAVTATNDVLGALSPHHLADIAVFDGRAHADYRAVIDAKPEDVTLVFRGGKVLYGDLAPVSTLSPGCDEMTVCTVKKAVCLASDIGKDLAALTAAAPGLYDLYFCGDPDDEPTCKPSRTVSVNGSSVYDGEPSTDDPDGDGLDTTADLCPRVFDPIRPLDDGAQADADGDGVGDACDPCPLDANTTSCFAAAPLDRDGDGILTTEDNCPLTANPLQEDSDGDGKGDACDACATRPNPGSLPCPATIYEVKSGVVPTGTTLSVSNGLVTARVNSGFFLQVLPGDDGYQGSDYSGIFVFQNGNTVHVGDRLDLTTSVVSVFGGEIQLGTVTVRVSSSGTEAPAPVVVTPAEVATGGARAAALEGVLVEVQNVTVTDVNPPVGTGDTSPTHEFVASGVRVNDFIYLATPFPAVNATYQSITGVLHFRNGDSKIEPRNAADLVP